MKNHCEWLCVVSSLWIWISFQGVCFLPVFEALFLSLPGELSGVEAVLRQWRTVLLLCAVYPCPACLCVCLDASEPLHAQRLLDGSQLHCSDRSHQGLKEGLGWVGHWSHVCCHVSVFAQQLSNRKLIPGLRVSSLEIYCF